MMPSVHWIVALAAAGLSVGLPALAADRAVQMQVPPPIRKDVAAMPLIASPTDDAERRINTALQRLDGKIRSAAAGCKDDSGKPGDWERSVEVPMRGPSYISFVITDNAFCGGAHPSTATMAIVYDLRTGLPVDWTHLLPPSLTGKVTLTEGMDGTKMVTLASKRLYSLYIAGYDSGSGAAEDRASCKEAVQNTGSDGPPAMMAWLDARLGGLAVQFDLPHVVQACAVPIVIPVATLHADGAQPAMLDAIEAARRR
jgi:hypothetical protein